MVSSRMVLAGGNNITLSQSVNGQSATITISMGATGIAESFSAGVSTLGNTAGTTGLVSNQLVLVGGNNITLSQSTNANSATISINAGATAVAPTLSIWRNHSAGGTNTTASIPNNTFFIVMLDPKNDVFPGNMTAKTAYFMISVDVPGIETLFEDKADSVTLRLGIYTRNASTLSILNSVSTNWSSFGTGKANSFYLAGIRWITFNSSQWSSSPTFSNTDYYLGYIFNISDNTFLGGTTNSYSYIGNDQFQNLVLSGTIGASITSGNTSMGQIPYVGVSKSSIANTSPLPTSIQLSELNKATNNYGYSPNIVFMNVSSNF